MKIGFLITYFYPKTGGAENNCYYLARELAKRHEVHVFCSGEKESDEVIEGIQVHRSKEIFRIKYYLGFYPSIVKKLQAYKLDVLHVHGLGFVQHDIAIRKLRKVNKDIKLVCTPHGPFMALEHYNLMGMLFKKIYTPFIRSALKDYDILIQVNPYQYQWMAKEYGIPKRKIKFLPNGIDETMFTEAKKYTFKNSFVISYLGRIQEYKGLDQVIRALPELAKVQKNILFVMMGKDVGDRKRLEKIALELHVEKHIRFMGEVSEQLKRGLLDASEIFIFPSQWEAFGIVVLEAMARGNSIVSTNTEGGKYLIKEGENGYLFSYGNEKEFLSSMTRIIRDPRLRKKMQDNNRKKARKFLWKDIARQLEMIYR
ncbi:glycosyltransferase family 4 protein [Candidatus Pacearchaeota archaeon]|nr:glycosyltransferase family 4 protein [Candidatus Pacearchaeota archaeon]